MCPLSVSQVADCKIFNNPCKIFKKTGGGKLVTFNSSPRFNLILEQPENIIVPANRIFALFRIPLHHELLVSVCDSSSILLVNFHSFHPDSEIVHCSGKRRLQFQRWLRGNPCEGCSFLLTGFNSLQVQCP